MSKIDYARDILPDIEMYGGSTDLWEIPLYRESGARMTYIDAQSCTFTLVIKDYGYTHRTNGSTYFVLEKSGTVLYDDDLVSGLVSFRFTKSDTFGRYGKFIYQVIAESGDGSLRNIAQGSLFITKAIDQ